MDLLTHALTIHQPWAWAVAAGHKPVENRTWRPPLEAVGKLIGIHAGLARWTDDTGRQVRANMTTDLPDDLPRGALIGVARLVGVLRTTKDGRGYALEHGRGEVLADRLSDTQADAIRPWVRANHVWWYFREAVLLPEPIPMRGQQGLWRIPDSLRIDAAGKSYDSGPAAWALEQWRKAREMR